MPKAALGEVLCVKGTWTARVTIAGRERPSFPMPWCKTEAQATVRTRLLADTARQLRAANVSAEAVRKLLNAIAEASSERALRIAVAAVGEVAGQRVRPIGAPHAPSFKELGTRWTTGQLAREHPDQIKAKRSADDDEQRLRMYIYPVLGEVPIDRVTLDLCEDVMRRLPSKLEASTRRNIGQLMTRLLSISVYPLRLIAMSPIPRGFLPKPSKRKALAHLYPDEDARLLACTSVPLAYRVLWGFLSREGMREGEALRLDWTDLDLQRGAVRLDVNKTDDPRAWALHPGTTAALRALRELRSASDRVFVDEHGLAFTASGALGLPAMLRAHLRQIGLADERPELFESTNERRQMRVHDLRGTFVTINLANGKSEAWIADRTGHRSSQMIARYKRVARTFAELQTGDLAPLNDAIPELRADTPATLHEKSIAHRLPIKQGNHMKSLASPAGFENEDMFSQPIDIVDKSTITQGACTPTPAVCDTDGQSMGEHVEPPAPPSAAVATPVAASVPGDTGDSIEADLAAAIRHATAAAQWHVVALLARELETRHKRSEVAPGSAASGASVIDLNEVRRLNHARVI